MHHLVGLQPTAREGLSAKPWPCLQGTPVRVQILIASVLRTAPWTNMPPSPKALQRGDGFEGNQLLPEKEKHLGQLWNDQVFIQVAAAGLLIF